MNNKPIIIYRNESEYRNDQLKLIVRDFVAENPGSVLFGLLILLAALLFIKSKLD